jgi:hypothetical protein
VMVVLHPVRKNDAATTADRFLKVM